MNVNECESCAAPVVWAKTINGQRMPVDAQPSPEHGNVIVTGRPPHVQAGVLSKLQAEGARRAGQQLHTSHFATCPYASHHRSRDLRKRARR